MINREVSPEEWDRMIEEERKNLAALEKIWAKQDADRLAEEKRRDGLDKESKRLLATVERFQDELRLSIQERLRLSAKVRELKVQRDDIMDERDEAKWAMAELGKERDRLADELYDAKEGER